MEATAKLTDKQTNKQTNTTRHDTTQHNNATNNQGGKKIDQEANLLVQAVEQTGKSIDKQKWRRRNLVTIGGIKPHQKRKTPKYEQPQSQANKTNNS